MKPKTFQPTRFSLLLLPLLALALGGCQTSSKPGLMDQPADDPSSAGGVARLHIGDTVTITFSGLPDEMPMQEKPIKEDGTITLLDIGRIKAAGKTPGELEDTIHDLYVPKYVTHLNVTVKTSSDRVYFVRGCINRPDRYIYAGSITVSKAITSAGDFTDFADRSDVTLTRADGKRFQLNLNHILAGKDPDPPVYPGDQIEVGKRIF
jgi:polysaccharide export outer membrane protein